MTEFVNVSKKYNDIKVIEGFSLSVANGERVVLMGESGIGKTTILNIAAGLVKADNGEFKTTCKTAYMFQEPRLLPTFTVKKNVLAVLKSKEKTDLAEKYLKLAELDGHKDKYPSELSGGMAQRVAFARFLAYAEAICAEVLILDEPFSSLDLKTKVQAMNSVKDIIKKENLTMVFVTHDILEAVNLADRIVVLDKGKIVYDENKVNEKTEAELFGLFGNLN